MEPSLNRMTPETFQTLVNRGFHNFLYSEEDFILHYCLYHFLFHDSFDYHITDISKGAMNILMAHLQRNQRYANWLIILKKELEFFNNPPLIAIGCRSRDFLSKTGHFQLEFSVMHYSQNNSARFRDYYIQHSHKSLTGDLHIKLKAFAVRMLDDQNYNAQLKIEILLRLFNNELSIWKKGLFLKYMDEFSVTRN